MSYYLALTQVANMELIISQETIWAIGISARLQRNPTALAVWRHQIDTDYLLEKLKSFYGLGKDEEVREWEKERSKNMLMSHAADVMDDVILPLDASEFEAIGSYEEMESLQELMKKKNLGRDEIALVLKCLKKNR